MEQNANYFPWEETKEDNVFPTGVYHMSWKLLEDGESQTGKRMFRAVFECKQPVEYAGMAHFEYFVTGTDENLKAIVPGAMGTRSMKKALKAAQVPPNNDIQQLVFTAMGSELMLTINEYTEKEGAYAGTLRNRIADYHRIGEREAKVAEVQGGPASGGSVQPPPVAPPSAPAAPAPTMPPPPMNQAPAPVAAPTQPAAPVTPLPPPAATSVGQVMRCTICQADVPIADFSAHVQGHMAQQ